MSAVWQGCDTFAPVAVPSARHVETAFASGANASAWMDDQMARFEVSCDGHNRRGLIGQNPEVRQRLRSCERLRCGLRGRADRGSGRRHRGRHPAGPCHGGDAPDRFAVIVIPNNSPRPALFGPRKVAKSWVSELITCQLKVPGASTSSPKQDAQRRTRTSC